MEISNISNYPMSSSSPGMTSGATKPSRIVDAQAGAVSAAGSTPSASQIKEAVSSLNKVVQELPNSSSLEFMVDPDTKISVVKVVDTSTNKVISQFPSEEVIGIAKAMDKLQGLLLRQKA